MAYHKILVPFDGSDHAKSALGIAKQLLSQDDDARIFVLNIVPMAVVSAIPGSGPATSVVGEISNFSVSSDMIESALETFRQEMVEGIGDTFDDIDEKKIVVEAIAHPSPVHGIADYALSHDCDVIVMGRRGLGAVRGLLGSVSYGVLRTVDIPVMTVK
jgi:nucleotide-binding universal stress UspA family protein